MGSSGVGALRSRLALSLGLPLALALLPFALALALPTSARADVGFLDALAIAEGDAGPALTPVDIARVEGRYRVRFATDEGSLTVEVHAETGEVVRREIIAVDPVAGAYTPATRRLVRGAAVSLADAVRLAQRYDDGPLVRVALQALDDRLVIETQHWDGQIVVGRVIDPARGVAIVPRAGEPTRVPS